MQKKLIALAVATAFSGAAFAQSNVTISGKVVAGFEQYKLSDTGATTSATENRVSDGGSRLIFNGTENLGGGLSAIFQVDNRFNADTVQDSVGATGTAVTNGRGVFGGGNTFVGLKSDTLGEFKLGRTDFHYQEFGSIESNRAGSAQTNHAAGIMTQVNGTNAANPTRTNNAMWWDSPNWNGVTARVGFSTAQALEGTGLGATDAGKNNAYTLALRYNNGPIAAGVSYWNSKTEGAATTTGGAAASATTTLAATGTCATGTTASNLGGSGLIAACVSNVVAATAVYDNAATRAWFGYTFPFGLKVGLGWDSSKRTSRDASLATDRKRTAWTLPVSYSMGNHAFYATYSKAGDTSNVTASGARQYTLGYDYALSKRTAVGAYYTNLRNDSAGAYGMFAITASGQTANTAGIDSSQLYMGVSHSF